MVTGIVLVNVERAMIRSVIEDLMRIEESPKFTASPANTTLSS